MRSAATGMLKALDLSTLATTLVTNSPLSAVQPHQTACRTDKATQKSICAAPLKTASAFMFFLVQSAHLAKPTTMDTVSGSAAWANTAANRTALTLTSRPLGRHPIVWKLGYSSTGYCQCSTKWSWMGGDHEEPVVGLYRIVTRGVRLKHLAEVKCR
jgi:hypothetical protein